MSNADSSGQEDDIDPVTIVAARCPAEAGRWFALPCEPWDVPPDIFDDENTAYAWYENTGLWSFSGRYGGATSPLPLGVGRTPSGAYSDLARRLRGMEPVRRAGFSWYEFRWRMDATAGSASTAPSSGSGDILDGLRAWYQKEVPPAVTWVNEAFDKHRFDCYRSGHPLLWASERNVDG
jgi:hypothetical protein